MSLYFFDSSALAKLFIAEAGSDIVASLVDELNGSSRFVSALAPIEIRSALRRREALQELSAESTSRAIQRLHSEMLSFTVLEVTSELLQNTASVIDRYQLRALDALQLASALLLTKWARQT